MRGLRKYLTPFAPDQSGAVSMNLVELSPFAMLVVVPEISVDLMSHDGLRVKVHYLVRDFVTWTQSLDVMISW